MATQIQYRRGTDTQNNAFTGVVGEITVDTTAKTLRVHDGATAGGSNIATVSYVDNQIGNIEANAITFGSTSMSIASSGANIVANVAGTEMAVFSASGIEVTGLLSATTTITATGNVDGGNLTTAGSVSGNGRPLTSLNASNIDTGTIPDARIQSSGVTQHQANITGTGALDSGSITSGFGSIDIGTDTVTLGGILNGNADGVGNIGASGDSFNTVFAKATSAQYADLAEKYEADTVYIPGTVLSIGGNKEVTQSTQYADSAVVGVVSTNPAHIMNSSLEAEYVIDLALTGRVPCRVVGTISKGDVLTSSDIPGVATKLQTGDFIPGCVLGKALQNYNSDEVGVIEVLVGKL